MRASQTVEYTLLITIPLFDSLFDIAHRLAGRTSVSTSQAHQSHNYQANNVNAVEELRTALL